MKGNKVHLRELEPEDVELLYSWENDPEIWRVSGTRTPYSKHTLRRYIESTGDLFTDGQLRHVIGLNENERPVGTIDLFDHDAVNRRAGVGVLIAEPGDRGKGYATEALQLLMEHVFDELGLHQLYCNIPASNQPSFELFKKVGFKEVGKKREWIRRPEQWEDEHLFQCIAREKERTGNG